MVGFDKRCMCKINQTQYRGETQIYYNGVSSHNSSLDFAVVNEKGRTTKRQRVNWGVKGLTGFTESVAQPRKVIIEEGELANWPIFLDRVYPIPLNLH